MANINSHRLTNDEEQLLYEASKDTIAFGKLFLPDDFLRSETPSFHYEVADALDDQEIKQLAIILPRGHGKTVLTKANLLRNFLFSKKEDPLFYGWVSATAKLATGNMDYIKQHIEMNPKIQYYFGNQKGRKWTEDDIEFANGCKLLSKSNISGIRGGAKMHKRYDLIILDDFEDENNTITQEARQKNNTLITAVVYPALEPHTGRLRINGTPVHFDSFINNLITNYDLSKQRKEDFAWNVILHTAIENGVSLWDSWFPMSKLEEKKKFYQDSGAPHKFYQEYMMQVQSEEDAIFNMKHIKYWNGSFTYNEDEGIGYLVEKNGTKPVNVYVGVDPATDTVRRDSDYTALVLISVYSDNKIYVIDYIRKRGVPVQKIVGEEKNGIVDYIFDLQNIYHPQLFCIEDTAMSRAVFTTLRSEQRRRNQFDIKFVEEKPGTQRNKRERILEVLSGRFSTGSVHIKKEHLDLQQEILTFGPRMGHDDTIDALAYAVKYATPTNFNFNKKDKTYSRQTWKKRSWIVA